MFCRICGQSFSENYIIHAGNTIKKQYFFIESEKVENRCFLLRWENEEPGARISAYVLGRNTERLYDVPLFPYAYYKQQALNFIDDFAKIIAARRLQCLETTKLLMTKGFPRDLRIHFVKKYIWLQPIRKGKTTLQTTVERNLWGLYTCICC